MLCVSGRLRLDQPAVYEIRLRGELGDDWEDWLDDGPRISSEKVSVESGVTVVRSTVADQSALYGLLNRIRSLSLTLLSVSCIRTRRTLA
jgi:hypothetical protein